MKVEVTPYNDHQVYVTFEEVWDQLVLRSPQRPLIVEMMNGEWNIWLNDESDVTGSPDRWLRGGK